MCNKGITQFYLPPTHEPYLPSLPSRKASPPFGRYQLILLGEQRHIGVTNLPRVFTPRARPRLEPMHDLLIVSPTLYRQRHDATCSANSAVLSANSIVLENCKCGPCEVTESGFHDRVGTLYTIK